MHIAYCILHIACCILHIAYSIFHILQAKRREEKVGGNWEGVKILVVESARRSGEHSLMHAVDASGSKANAMYMWNADLLVGRQLDTSAHCCLLFFHSLTNTNLSPTGLH